MHLSFALVALAAWLGSTGAVTLQTFAPCEDLSPHCPVLCASCVDARKWPDASHESYEIDSSSEEEDSHKPKPQKNNTSKPSLPGRPKRHNLASSRGWVSVPDKPKWMPTWVPWWYKPRPSHGGSHGGPPPPHAGGDRPDSHEKPEKPEPQEDKCGELMNGGRQLVEAFCPRSCGRCGKSSSPLAAAKVYIGAQCTVAKYVVDDKEAPVGLAVQE